MVQIAQRLKKQLRSGTVQFKYMAYSSYESSGAEDTQNRTPEKVLLANVLSEARRVLEASKIDINDFRDIYGSEKIKEDLKYVDKMERRFKEESTEELLMIKQLAIVFEAVFHKGAREHGWLGEGVRVIKASDVDDLRYGVDGIVEFQEEDANVDHLAIGVDVTFGNAFVRKKFARIVEDIKRGKLPTIEYFRSGNFRGELSNIPRVVVGAERNNLLRLSRDLFVNPDNERLAQHPYQLLQLRQMCLQLDAFEEYARRLGKKEIAKVYKRDAEIVRKILQKKSVGEGIRMVEWENDRVFAAIKEEIEKLQQ